MISLSNLCILDEYTLCIYLCLFGNLACLPIDYIHNYMAVPMRYLRCEDDASPVV